MAWRDEAELNDSWQGSFVKLSSKMGKIEKEKEIWQLTLFGAYLTILPVLGN